MLVYAGPNDLFLLLLCLLTTRVCLHAKKNLMLAAVKLLMPVFKNPDTSPPGRSCTADCCGIVPAADTMVYRDNAAIQNSGVRLPMLQDDEKMPEK